MSVNRTSNTSVSNYFVAFPIPHTSSNRSDNAVGEASVRPDDLAWASTIREAKAHWEFVLSAMQHLAPPAVVTAAATTALATTATLWHFSSTDAAAAVIDKCEERLPQISGDSVLGNLGKVLCILHPNATTAIWHHVKIQQTAKAGSPTRVPNAYDTMAKANLAWKVHYAQRLQQGCQRRNRLIDQTIDSTTSEIAELFMELDDAARLGVSATSARIEDEAGDVWYGAHCYAVAYTEQVQRVLRGWTRNMKAGVGNEHGSSQLFPSTPGGKEAHVQATHTPITNPVKFLEGLSENSVGNLL